MPDLERITQSFVLDFKKPVVNRLKVVNGDTANTFVITLKNGGAAVQLNANLHKVIAVFKRADGQVYTQDASCGVTFTTTGVVTIDVRPASFRSGTNTVELQVYKRENSSATEYPLLATTYPQAFTARNETLTGEGENAPSQLPMLEQIIHDAGEAVTNCNNATTAANNAATAATAAASSASDAAAAAISATAAALAAAAEANTKAGLANDAAAAATAAKNAADSATAAAESAAVDAAHAAQEAYTRGAAAGEAASSANTAAAAANAAAAAATAAAAAATEAAKKNLVLVKHDADWVSDTSAHGSTTLTATELRAMMPDSIFAIQVKGVNYNSDNSVITLIESFRDDESNVIYFRTSESVDKRMYVGSIDIDGTGSTKGTVDVNILVDESPLLLHVSDITINDEDEITSISFVETNQQIFAAIGVRPLEVIVVNDSKNYHLREWLNWAETIDPQTPSQTVVNKYAELTAQNVISGESVYLRIHAQKGLMSYTVSGNGAFSTRG